MLLLMNSIWTPYIEKIGPNLRKEEEKSSFLVSWNPRMVAWVLLMVSIIRDFLPGAAIPLIFQNTAFMEKCCS